MQKSASVQPRTSLSKFGSDFSHLLIRLLIQVSCRVSASPFRLPIVKVARGWLFFVRSGLRGSAAQPAAFDPARKLRATRRKQQRFFHVASASRGEVSSNLPAPSIPVQARTRRQQLSVERLVFKTREFAEPARSRVHSTLNRNTGSGLYPVSPAVRSSCTLHCTACQSTRPAHGAANAPSISAQQASEDEKKGTLAVQVGIATEAAPRMRDRSMGDCKAWSFSRFLISPDVA